MSERTDTPATPNSPPPRIVTGLEPRHCWWHNGPSASAVLINVVEQCSGPGASLYACAGCRSLHGLVPYAQRVRRERTGRQS